MSTALKLRNKLKDNGANIMLAKSLTDFSENLEKLTKYYFETTPEKWNGELGFSYTDKVLNNVAECYIAALLSYQLRKTKMLIRKIVSANVLSIELLNYKTLQRHFDNVVKKIMEESNGK